MDLPVIIENQQQMSIRDSAAHSSCEETLKSTTPRELQIDSHITVNKDSICNLIAMSSRNKIQQLHSSHAASSRETLTESSEHMASERTLNLKLQIT